MARVTVTEVRVILTTAEDASLSDPQVQAAIDDAHIVVDGFYQAPCYLADSDGGDARAKSVEKNLAADYAVGTSGGGTIEQEKMGDASEKRALSNNNQSQYYRKAQMLDCSGQLGETDKRPAGIYTIGSIDADSPREE